MDNLPHHAGNRLTGSRTAASYCTTLAACLVTCTLVAVYVLVASITKPTPVEAATDVKNSSLATNLVSYWSLEETSGTRNDSKGSNHLTDNNTVLYAAGIQGNAADIERDNTESLSIADASQSGLDLSGDFSFSFWVKQESDALSVCWICKFNGDGGATSRAYALYRRVNTTSSVDINISDGSTATWKYVNTITFTNGTWYHMVYTYSASAGTAKIYRNGSQIGSDLTGLPTSVYNNSQGFYIGRATNAGQNFDGLIDEVGVWSRVLSSTDVTDLYNSGSGIPYDAGGGAPAASVPNNNVILFE